MLRFLQMEDAQPPPRKKRKWLRRLTVLAVLLAFLGGLLWSGWYVYNRGFTRKWRTQLAAELRRRGLDFSARRLTLNPFEGLTAENVRIYLLDEQHTQLLYVDKVAVDIDLIAFIRHKPFLNSLDLRGARLTLPVDMAGPQGARKLKLRRLSAKVDFLPDEVRLTQADGEFYGLQLSASGSLLHPESFNGGREHRQRGREPPAAASGCATSSTNSKRSSPSTRRPGSKCVSRATSRNPAACAPPRSSRARRCGAVPTAWNGCWRGWTTARGRSISSRRNWPTPRHPRPRAISIPTRPRCISRSRVGLDLLTFAREFFDPKSARRPQAARFPQAPTRRTHALRHRPRRPPRSPAPAATSPPPPRRPPCARRRTTPPRRTEPAAACSSPAGSRSGASRTTASSSSAGKPSSRGAARWYLRGLRVVRPGGGNNTPQTLTADALSEPGACRLRLTSTFDPVPFFGLLPPKAQALLGRLEFRDPPRVELTASGPSFADPAALRTEGKITLGHTRYRGAGINGLKMDVAFADGVFTARHLHLERDEGTATGDLVTYDLARHEMRLDNVRSALDLTQAGVWLDPDVYHTILPFRFRRPPALVMNGVLQFEGGRNSHLVTNVDAPGGMDYVFEKKTLPFQSIAGQVVFTEERLWLNDVRSEIFNGQAHGSLNLALGKGSAHEYAATLDFKDLDFARLTKLYFDFDTSKGQLTGDYHFTGKGTDERTLHGGGALNVEHGNVFSIPFLGPLSPIFSAVLPGLGFDEAHQASVSFVTDKGKIFTGDMDVKGVGFSLFGTGWLGYADDTMNFRVRLNTRGLPGAVLRPMSDLFEYASTGPLSKPVWRPRMLSNLPPVTGEKKPPPTPPAASKTR